jgi:hypothetical protein
MATPPKPTPAQQRQKFSKIRSLSFKEIQEQEKDITERVACGNHVASTFLEISKMPRAKLALMITLGWEDAEEEERIKGVTAGSPAGRQGVGRCRGGGEGHGRAGARGDREELRTRLLRMSWWQRRLLEARTVILIELGWCCNEKSQFHKASQLMTESRLLMQEVLHRGRPCAGNGPGAAPGGVAAAGGARGRGGGTGGAEPRNGSGTSVDAATGDGDGHEDLAEVLNYQGLLHMIIAQYTSGGRADGRDKSEKSQLHDASLKCFNRSLAIRRALLGHESLSNSPLIAMSLNNIANLKRNVHKARTRRVSHAELREIEDLYMQSLKIRERALGTEHPHVAMSLNNLGLVLAHADAGYTRGREGELEQLYQRALYIRQKKFGKKHPETAATLNNIGNFYKKKARDEKNAAAASAAWEMAESHFREALAIREQYYDQKNDRIAQTLTNLAHLLADRAGLVRTQVQQMGLKQQQQQMAQMVQQQQKAMPLQTPPRGPESFQPPTSAAGSHVAPHVPLPIHFAAQQQHQQQQRTHLQQCASMEKQRSKLEKEAGDLFRKACKIRRELVPGTKMEADSLSKLAQHLQEMGDETQARHVLQQERLVRLQSLHGGGIVSDGMAPAEAGGGADSGGGAGGGGTPQSSPSAATASPLLFSESDLVQQEVPIPFAAKTAREFNLVGRLLGAGGKHLRDIEERSKVSVSIEPRFWKAPSAATPKSPTHHPHAGGAGGAVSDDAGDNGRAGRGIGSPVGASGAIASQGGGGEAEMVMEPLRLVLTAHKKQDPAQLKRAIALAKSHIGRTEKDWQHWNGGGGDRRRKGGKVGGGGGNRRAGKGDRQRQQGRGKGKRGGGKGGRQGGRDKGGKGGGGGGGSALSLGDYFK